MSAVPRKRAKTSSVYECRACLMKIHDDSCCVDIFCAWDSSWPGMGASIAQDLIKLSNVQISATDPHSKNICKSCCSRLREALLFTSIVQKNDLFIRKRLRESSSESPMWPKPIQVDKNITANTLNAMTAEVKEEVLTDDEQEINESCSELIEPKLDIKIEPEEMTPAAIPSIEIEINCPLLHPGRDDQEVKTNGATEILDEEPRRKKLTWSLQKMKLAVAEVKRGSKIHKTASKFGVPVMVLYTYVKRGSGYKPKQKGHPVFSIAQELDIRDRLVKLSQVFFGLTAQALRKFVYQYAEKNNIKHPFNALTKEAGSTWFYGFIKRNPEVIVRGPESATRSKITAFNQNEMTTFYIHLFSTIEKYAITPDRIFNVDETEVAIHVPEKILVPKGKKEVHISANRDKGNNVTVCCCMSATGQFVPPLFVFPCKQMTPELERGGPPGSIYRSSNSGGMTEELFMDWMKHFVEHAKPSLEDVVLLYLDNHESHISLVIHEFCRQNGVVMLSPPTLRRTQPLDLTFFGPLQQLYYKECKRFMKMNNVEKITQYNIVPLVGKAYLKTVKPEIAVNGFAEGGVWPINFKRLLAEVKEEPMSEDELEPAADMPKDCMLCLETFKTVKGLKAHVIAVHSYNTFTSPRAETVNVCTKCNRNFATPEELSTHKIGHSDFKCYICGKKFATFILLIKHKETCKPTSKLTRLETLEDVKSTIPVYYIIDRKLPQVKEKDPTPNSSKGLDSEVASTKEASSSVKELSVLGPLDSGKYKTKQENLPVEPSASRHLTDNDNPTVEKVTSTQNPILNQLSKTTLKKPDKVSSDDETNSIPNIKSEVLQAEEYTQKQQESVNIVKAVIADSESKQVTHKSEFKQESVETAHSNIMAIESKSNNDTEGSVQVQDNRSKVSNKKKENETEDDYKIKVNEPKVYKMEYIASEESISEVCNKTKGQRINTLETKLDVESQESNKMDDIRCQETNKPEDCNKTKGNVINTLETTLNEDSPESKTMDGVTSEDSNKTKECDITIPNEDEDSCASKENKKEETRRQSLVTCNNITTAPKQIDTEIKLNLSNEDSKPLLSKPQVENLETHSNPSEDSMEIQLEIQSIDEADAMDIDSDLRSEIKASSESDKHT